MANIDSMCLPDILAQSMPPKSLVEGWLGSARSNDDDGDSVSITVFEMDLLLINYRLPKRCLLLYD